MEHRYAQLGGITLHYVEAGEGPLVLLLHGFPEFWYSWRFQIPALAEAGFRVVAPDMRGYNLSDKPYGVENYRVETLSGDVEKLITHLGEKRAFVVGHDWGGAVAWATALRHPERVEKLAVLNCPHPGVFVRRLFAPKQLRKSWYMFALQVPGAPGRYIERRVFEGVISDLRIDPVRKDAFTPEDISRYEEAMMSRSGALTSATNYYRAMFRYPPRDAFVKKQICAPTLLVWGENDRYLGTELSVTGPELVLDLRTVRIPGVSHWVQQERPGEVNELLTEFLSD